MTSLKEAFTHFSLESKRLEEHFKRLENEFKASSSTLKTIIQHINCGVIFISTNQLITVFNEAAVAITGISQSDCLLKPYHDYFSDTLFGFSLEDALRQKSSISHTFVTLQNGTSEKQLEIALTTTLEGVIIMLRDVTEVRKLQHALHHHERLKSLGEVAALLAHEIRNPLCAITGFASMLAQDLEAQPQLAQMAKLIVEGTKHLNQLVTTILLYAKPLQMHFVKTDLAELLQRVCDLHFSPKKIALHLPHEPIFSWIDQEHLTRALLNLLINATDAAKTQVDIFLQQKADQVTIAFQDDGEGIAESIMDKIFTPFFTTKAKGTGLGLPDAHKIVEAHGGTLILTQPPTRFTLHLSALHAH